MDIATKYVGLAAIGGTVGLLWSKVKMVFSYLHGLVFITINTDTLTGTSIIGLIRKEGFRPIRMNNYDFESFGEYVRPKKRRMMVVFERFGRRQTIFIKGWKLIWISTSSKNDNNAPATSSRGDYSFKFTFLRGCFGVYDLITKSEIHYNDRSMSRSKDQKKRYGTYRIIGNRKSRDRGDRGESAYVSKSEAPSPPEVSDLICESIVPVSWKPDELGDVCENPVKFLYYPPEIDSAIEEAKMWIDNENWFRERGVPWKRGWIMTGPPGCVVSGTKIKIRKISQEGNSKIYIE